MANQFQKMSEGQIRKAQAEGQLTGLAGEGKPLPDRPGDAFISPGDAIGHRIMAEAGALPEEIKLKKAIAATKAHYQTLTGDTEKRSTMSELADLQLRLGIAEDARRKFLGS